MGLDTTHDAFRGAYSAFNRFRKEVAAAAGGSFPPHNDESLDPNRWYVDDSYNEDANRGLWLFLGHSDCDGELSPEECVLVADELERLLPNIKESRAAKAIDGRIQMLPTGGGHIDARGGMVEVTRKFIAGCRLAAERGETLEFR